MTRLFDLGTTIQLKPAADAVGLVVSPNGKAILEKTSNQFGADLMLIEGFRNAS